jgi:hypothetical protein
MFACHHVIKLKLPGRIVEGLGQLQRILPKAAKFDLRLTVMNVRKSFSALLFQKVCVDFHMNKS